MPIKLKIARRVVWEFSRALVAVGAMFGLVGLVCVLVLLLGRFLLRDFWTRGTFRVIRLRRRV